MTEFTCLLGEPALSEFRKNKLVRLLQSRCQLNASIDARFVYFVEASLTLEQAEKARLEDILHARLAQPSDFKQSILVIPRLGTLSPWSSKATDIATRCGIDKVNRIERGTVYRINAQDGDLASVSYARVGVAETGSIVTWTGKANPANILAAHIAD